MTDVKSTNDQPRPEDSNPKARITRERSTIQFPYTDLLEAASLAKAVREVGGSACEWDQLAAKLNFVATGGGFRQRVMGARVFQIVEYSQKRVSLTNLGSRICDGEQEESAKVEAFLAVPLYKAVYDKFMGATLPPATGLEAEMTKMGVPQKQARRARQVFQRSAGQAGFFWSGKERLVKPAVNESGTPNGRLEDERDRDEVGNEDKVNGSKELHPFVEGLIKSLPRIGEPWPLGKRVQWLQAAVSCFNLIYPDDDPRGSVEVKLLEESK